MTAEIIALTEELRVTTEMLGRVVLRLDEADKRANTHRAWTIVLALCVGAVFLLAVWTFSVANKSQKTLDRQVADRLEARITACESYNTDTVDRINGILLRASRDPHRIEDLLLPHRDCTEVGIAAYFDGDDATDPFIPVTIPEEGS